MPTRLRMPMAGHHCCLRAGTRCVSRATVVGVRLLLLRAPSVTATVR
jgi:hypothetical protein